MRDCSGVTYERTYDTLDLQGPKVRPVLQTGCVRLKRRWHPAGIPTRL